MNTFKNTYLGILALLLYSCGTPVLNGLDPSSGPQGTLVTVNGSNLLGATVYWDYGLATQTTLPSNFISVNHFTVPLSASLGNHPVRLAIGNNYSANTINFDVVNGVIRPKPRIDYLTCYGFNIDNNGMASFFLLCSGANIDVGAKLNINGGDSITFFTQALRNTNLTATDLSTLGYPIPNYGMVWALVSKTTPGTTLTVKIKNLDGTFSDEVTYNIAPSMALLDSDGDGLLDDWENNGYDANGDGTVDIDLKTLGADPNHKDLFVEADWMNGFAPINAIWAPIETVFANAPILNGDGNQGIAIHIDRGQAGAGGGGGTVIAMSNYIRYDGSSSPAQTTGQTTANFHTLKSNNFNANRLNIYRYCIFANDNGYSSGSSGRAENIWANDFFVSLGSVAGGSQNQQITTFIHELGHTLNLFHGGFEDKNYKPSYNSIMNYQNQWPGIDINCNNAGDNIFTYSQGMRNNLNENSLNENAGVCDNISIDWNSNGSITNPVSQDINSDGSKTTLNDFADWGNLKIDFRAAGSNWGSN
ncbi:MAG: hypothetical protein U0W24_04265 [Bacteroidales bacterium]